MGMLLGVRIDQVTKKQALDQAAYFLSGETSRTIFTPNPEMLVFAKKYPWFREILNKGDLNLCDGIGAAFFLKTKRIAGIDFMLDLCALAEQKGKTVYLLGSRDTAIVEKTKECLRKKFFNLNIVGFHPGSIIQLSNNPIIKNDDKEINKMMIQDIQTKNPDILLIAFGHGKQEWWISEYLKQLPSVKIAMGVGGAFDMLAGKQKRAPKWLRAIGLEWLWRLFSEPRRFSRILTAIFVFPFLVLRERYF